VLKVKGNTLFTVSPDALLSDGVMTMAENDIGSLVVMSQGQLVGMLTFREVLKVLAQRQAEHRAGPTPPVAEIYIRDVMKADPKVVSPEMDVNDLRRVMIETRERYVPVMEGEVLLGVISFHDVA